MSSPPLFPTSRPSFRDFERFCEQATPFLTRIQNDCLDQAEQLRCAKGKIESSELEELSTKIAKEGFDRLGTELERTFNGLNERENVRLYVGGKRDYFLFISYFRGEICKALKGEEESDLSSEDDPDAYDWGSISKNSPNKPHPSDESGYMSDT